MQTSLDSSGQPGGQAGGQPVTDQLERRLDVAVPLAEIEGEVDKRLARLARTVKVAGFRPGKVPMKMVAQQYGSQVRSDVISDAVQKSFNDAVRAQNLRVAGYPRIEPKTGDGTAGALQFSAIFEIFPEVRVGDVSSLPIDRPEVEVTADDVDRTLTVLRKQRAEYLPATRPANDGDRVVVDFAGTIDGVEFAGGQARDFSITIGEGRMLPEFDAALRGTNAGDRKEFALTFPGDYHGKEVAGKTAHFVLTVKEVSEAKLPPLDEAFAKAFGIKSGKVADLRSEVTANLQLELKRKIESVVKDQAMKGLRDRAQFSVPKSLVEMEAQQMMRRMSANLAEQGMKQEDIKLTPDLFRPQAEDRVALGLILQELVRTNKLEARPDQVKTLVAEAAQTYEQPEAVIRWHFEKPERLNEFEAMAVEHNVVDWVLSRAQVRATPTSFEALMRPPQGQ